MDILVRFDHEDGRFFAQGRNGPAYCAGIQLAPGAPGNLVIGFITSKNKILNGGAVVPVKAFEELCREFLEQCGYITHPRLYKIEEIEISTESEA